MIGARGTFGPRGMRVVAVVRELVGDAQVLVVAVRADPLVPLLAVPPPQCFDVHRGFDVHPAASRAKDLL